MSENGGDSILTGSMKRLDGSDQDLSEFEGDVVLVVNTASKCGLTPQYEGLQRLYDEKNDAGFTVLGFPANDFFEQEPGGEDEIAFVLAILLVDEDRQDERQGRRRQPAVRDPHRTQRGAGMELRQVPDRP